LEGQTRNDHWPEWPLFPWHSGTALRTALKFEAETALGVVVSAELASEFFAGNTSGRIRSKIGRMNFFIMSNFGGEAHGVGNYWTSLDEWPTFTLVNYYMQPGRMLSDVAASNLQQTKHTYRYTYDPSTPDGLTPMLGGDNLPLMGHISRCGSADQLKRENRSDVVVFDSDVLAEELPVVGRLQAKLFVSSSTKDTDFVVTVSDLGKKKSMLVRYGAVRMRWREGDLQTAPSLVPGKVYEIDFDLWHTAYIFPKGHRVRVTISSAAYPYYDANPNTGSPESASIPPSKFKPVPAHNTILMGKDYPSKLSLPVVKMQDIPRNPHFGPSFPPIASMAAEVELLV
jgi:putative CocE/NonD family hydrolase